MTETEVSTTKGCKLCNISSWKTLINWSIGQWNGFVFIVYLVFFLTYWSLQMCNNIETQCGHPTVSDPFLLRWTTFSPTFWKGKDQGMHRGTWKLLPQMCAWRGLLCFLCTHLLQNVIQKFIEIIFLNWCMITITKSFIGYIFSTCKWVSV